MVSVKLIESNVFFNNGANFSLPKCVPPFSNRQLFTVSFQAFLSGWNAATSNDCKI